MSQNDESVPETVPSDAYVHALNIIQSGHTNADVLRILGEMARKGQILALGLDEC